MFYLFIFYIELDLTTTQTKSRQYFLSGISNIQIIQRISAIDVHVYSQISIKYPEASGAPVPPTLDISKGNHKDKIGLSNRIWLPIYNIFVLFLCLFFVFAFVCLFVYSFVLFVYFNICLNIR